MATNLHGRLEGNMQRAESPERGGRKRKSIGKTEQHKNLVITVT
jgi:hypothetical protein